MYSPAALADLSQAHFPPAFPGWILPLGNAGTHVDFVSLTLFLAVGALIGYSVLLYQHVKRLNSQATDVRQDAENEMVRLLSVVGCPAFLMDADGKILRINDDAERFFGSSCLDFKGMQLDLVFPKTTPVFSQKDSTYFHTEVRSRLEDMIGVNVRIMPLKFSTQYIAIMTIRESETHEE
jgi:hypothetical protein